MRQYRRDRFPGRGAPLPDPAGPFIVSSRVMATQRRHWSTTPEFRPARGLGNSHVQTFAGKVLRPALDIPLHRERIETPDGDFLDLDFAGWPPTAPDTLESAPLVLVLHGLEGTSRRRYMTSTYHALLGAGMRPVALNFRGCSGEPNRATRAYHSGETEDLAFILDLLRDRFGGPLGLVGYSLGGNVVLKFLGERGDHARDLVAAAVAVSVPFDLAAGARRLERGLLGRLYSHYFLSKLRRKVREKEELLRDACDVQAALRAPTVRAFDDALTAPLHGFHDAADYYDRSSARRYIRGIRVPTLILHSRDDPFLPEERIPADALEENPHVFPMLTDRGGHVAFVGGSVFRPDFWGERTLARFLDQRLGAAPG
jgi:uncharacterized protein